MAASFPIRVSSRGAVGLPVPPIPRSPTPRSPVALLFLVVATHLACHHLLRHLTPLVVRRGWLDRLGGRRDGDRAVPPLGGVAIALAVATGLGAWTLSASVTGAPGVALPRWGAWTWGGVALILATGIVDDRRGLSPRAKLTAQLLAAALAITGGASVHGVALVAHGAVLPLSPMLGGAAMLLWLVACTNALNLADGIDGLAGSVALVALASAVLLTALHDRGGPPGSLVLVLALAGALTAFLRHNWPPARVFLGDAGAMPLGFLLGLLLIPGWAEGRGVAYPVAAVAALAYPFTDTAVAIVRRWRAGVPVTRGDRRHIHHRLLARGAARAVWWIAGASVVTAAAGLASTGTGIAR